MAKNRDYWNHLAEVNWRSDFYDVAGFLRGEGALDEDVAAAFGDVAGRRVLHLQCHFGMDTLRLACRGAEVTGVDLSPVAIGRARELAARAELAGRFVEADVLTLDLGETFDLVFSSWGAIGWLPSLEAWGAVVRRHLRPGGRFVLVEGHPFLWALGEALPMAVKYDYFEGAPIVTEPRTGAYADPTAEIPMADYGWNHGVAEILGALLAQGLTIEALHETERIPWAAFPEMVKDGAYYRLPPGHPRFPLALTVVARLAEVGAS